MIQEQVVEIQEQYGVTEIISQYLDLIFYQTWAIIILVFKS